MRGCAPEGAGFLAPARRRPLLRFQSYEGTSALGSADRPILRLRWGDRASSAPPDAGPVRVARLSAERAVGRAAGAGGACGSRDVRHGQARRRPRTGAPGPGRDGPALGGLRHWTPGTPPPCPGTRSRRTSWSSAASTRAGGRAQERAPGREPEPRFRSAPRRAPRSRPGGASRADRLTTRLLDALQDTERARTTPSVAPGSPGGRTRHPGTAPRRPATPRGSRGRCRRSAEPLLRAKYSFGRSTPSRDALLG